MSPAAGEHIHFHEGGDGVAGHIHHGGVAVPRAVGFLLDLPHLLDVYDLHVRPSDRSPSASPRPPAPCPGLECAMR